MAIHLAETVQFFYQWAAAEAGHQEAVVGGSVDSAAVAAASAAAARVRAGNENADARIPQQA